MVAGSVYVCRDIKSDQLDTAVAVALFAETKDYNILKSKPSKKLKIKNHEILLCGPNNYRKAFLHIYIYIYIMFN